MKTYRIGIVGFGFIGKVHAYGHLNLPLYYSPLPFRTRITHICTGHLHTAQSGAEMVGADEAVTDYREITENPDIDIVHICSPNHLHLDQLLSAMAHEKAIFCDKPLVASFAEAQQIQEAIKSYSNTCGLTFHNRFFPATLRARQLVEAGLLGRILTFRAAYLHSGSANPQAPLKWKLSAAAGGGVIADLGSHVLDLLHHLIGDFVELNAATQIAFATRPDPQDPTKTLAVDAEDNAVLLARMQPRDFGMNTPALGTIEATKLATGTGDELRIEIHGTEGGIRYNSTRPHYLEHYRQNESDQPIGGTRGWIAIETGQGYPQPAAAFPSSKMSIGWMRAHLACLAGFMFALHEERPVEPDVHQGIYIQHVMECIRDSARSRQWVSLKPRRDFNTPTRSA
jgi:predicted dehydrogenase